jgi:hypothetical protein
MGQARSPERRVHLPFRDAVHNPIVQFGGGVDEVVGDIVGTEQDEVAVAEALEIRGGEQSHRGSEQLQHVSHDTKEERDGITEELQRTVAHTSQRVILLLLLPRFIFIDPLGIPWEFPQKGEFPPFPCSSPSHPQN